MTKCKCKCNEGFYDHTPDLDTRIHVIVDVIVLQDTMAIVIEVHTDLCVYTCKHNIFRV